MSELKLIESLLKEHANSFYARSVIAPLIASRAFDNRHLYQDMGFKSRGDFNTFMRENYPSLADIKPDNIRWKKYLFDCIDSVAPACKKCPDTTICFSCEILV